MVDEVHDVGGGDLVSLVPVPCRLDEFQDILVFPFMGFESRGREDLWRG